MTSPGSNPHLPEAAEAERVILGYLFIAGGPALRDVLEAGLDPSHLHDERNRILFKIQMYLYARNKPVDQVLAKLRLQQTGQLEQVGAEYLSSLTNEIPRQVNLLHYVQEVRKTAALRRAAHSANHLQLAILNGDDLGEVLTEHREAMDGLGGGDVDDLDPWKSRTFTLKDSLQPLPAVKDAVRGLIQIPSVNVLYAPPASHKTNLAIDMGMCVSAGLEWNGPLPNLHCRGFETVQCPVAMVDCDNGLRRDHERVGAFARGHGVPEDAPFFYISMPSPWLNAADTASMGALARRVKARGIGFLIVDNLAVVSGGADENAPEMAPIMAAWRRLSEECNAAVLLLHHPNKNTHVNRAGDRLRGHGSIEASLDLALSVEREDRSNTLIIRSTKSRGADVPPFSSMFTYDNVPGTSELYSARFYGVAMEDTGSDRAIEATIIEAVTVNPGMNKRALAETVRNAHEGVGINRIGGLIDRLASTKRITCDVGERGTHQYRMHGVQARITELQTVTEGP